MNPTSSPKNPYEESSKKLLVAGRYTEAVSHLQAWVRSDPTSVTAFTLLGTAFASVQEWDKAILAYEGALAVNAYFVEANIGCAIAHHALGHYDFAIASYGMVLSEDPENAAVLSEMGLIYLGIGKPEEATELFSRAVKVDPLSAVFHHNLAVAHRNSTRIGDAALHARLAFELDPESTRIKIHLANVLNDLELYTDALGVLGALPDEANTQTVLTYAGTLRGLMRHGQSEVLLRRELERTKDLPAIWLDLGYVLLEQGKTQEAEVAFDEAIQLAPLTGAHHRAKAEVHRYPATDPHLDQMLELVKQKGLGAEDLIQLEFALGKAFDDRKDFENAMLHFNIGNRKKRERVEYNEAGVDLLMDRIIGFFPRPISPSGENDSELPVFVVGMPRSGTTLVEQILASHPSVVGLGERPDLARILDVLVFNASEGQDGSLTLTDFTNLGSDYLEAIGPDAQGAERAVNKLPANFFFLGFIAEALPKAKIVHVRRDPVDTCLSLYMRLFTQTQTFSYDLGELGRYYRRYESLMKHWRKVLPPSQMIEIQYEQLVANPEAETRRLVKFLNLPWHPACLSPHETDRIITTASLVQVRQPIYQSSVGRRNSYLPYLGELLAELGS
jgi:tetratricopeptide (TPR) repeat protein